MSDNKTREVNYGADIDDLRKQIKALQNELAELRRAMMGGNVYTYANGGWPASVVGIGGEPVKYSLGD